MQTIYHFFSKILIFLSLITFSTAQAYELGGLVGLNYLTPSVSNNNISLTSYSGTPSFGLGGVSQFSLIDKTLELEIDLLLNQQAYSWTSSPILIEYSFFSIQAPVLVRYTNIPYIQPGLGLFLSLGMGNVTAITTGGSTPGTKSLTFDGALISPFSFGFAASIKTKIEINNSMSLIADGRYLLALSNNASNTISSSFKMSGLQFMAGLQFTLGGSKSSDEDSYTPRKKSSSRQSEEEEEPIKPASKKKSSTKAKSR